MPSLATAMMLGATAFLGVTTCLPVASDEATQQNECSPIQGNNGQNSGRKIMDTMRRRTVSIAPTRA